MKLDWFKVFFQKFFFNISIDERFDQLYTVDNPVQYSREQTVNVVLKIITFTSTIGLLIAPIILKSSWFDPAMRMYLIVIPVFWIVTLSKRFSYRFRIFFVLVAMYSVGVYDIWVTGLAEDGRTWLFMFVICTAILTGRRVGIFAIFICALSILGMGLAQVHGILDTSQFKYGVGDLTTSMVHGVTITFTISTILAFIPVVIILKTLDQMFNRMIILRQKQEETNQQLQNISQALEKALHAEKELNNIQSNVLRTVSHEFRTPLSVIAVSSSLLKKHGDKFDEAKTALYFDRIQQSINDLSHMLSNTILVNQLQEQLKQLNYQLLPSFYLIEGWQTIMDDMKKHNDQEIQLVVAQLADDSLYIEPQFIEQVFRALLENAVQYSNEKSTIIVTYQWDGKMIQWTIVDEGFGIPEKDLERVFQPFYRSDNVAHIPGVGVGLYRVQTIVSAMRGTITLANRPERSGVIATVKIPAVAQESTPVLEEKQAEAISRSQ